MHRIWHGLSRIFVRRASESESATSTLPADQIQWRNYGARFVKPFLCTSMTVISVTTMDALCARSLLSLSDHTPWYMPLWRTPATVDDKMTIKSGGYTHTVMVGHLELRDSILALEHLSSKTRSTTATDQEAALFDALDRLKTAVERSYPLYENYSLAVCYYRDLLNHEFLAPQIWVLRSINRHANSWLFPAFKVYSADIQSELQFQAQRFVKESLWVVEQLKAASGAVDLPTPSDLLELLRAALKAIESYQENLRSTLPQRCAYLTTGLMPHLCPEFSTFEKNLARSDRMKKQIETLVKIIPKVGNASERLRQEIHHMRFVYGNVARTNFAAEGVIQLPSNLQLPTGTPPFAWLRPVWSQDADNPNDDTNTLKRYHYNLNKTADLDGQDNLSGLAQICEGPADHFLYGGLYMICSIWDYARTFSELNDDLLGGDPRSWVRVRADALARYRQSIGADPATVAWLARKANEDYLAGKPISDYLDWQVFT
ncbi:MAG: hypothetical protein Q9176_007262 [Flavoplaca citrina]